MKFSLQKKVFLGFGLSSTLLILVTSSGYETAKRLAETKQWEVHTKQVLRVLEDISADLSDAETGQRGYLLTQQKRYLQPYQNAIIQIDQDLDILRSLTLDNQIQQQNLQSLSNLIDKKLLELETTITLSRTVSNQAAINLVKTNEGKNLMDGIRQVLQEMKQEEERLFEQRLKVTDQVIENSYIVLGLGIFFDLGLLSVLYLLIYREIRQKIVAQMELIELNKAALRFVPEKFIKLLNKESLLDVHLGDQVEREMSVLFSDIRSFTAISESLSPEDNFKLINAYLSRMTPVITEHHGFIDKYIGDAIMALFSRSSDDAVKAAIAMLKTLNEYNQNRIKSGYIPLEIGIGINTGKLMLGTVGDSHHMEGTVISDAVNLASRIEELTKIYQIPLLISESTFCRLQSQTDYAIRLIDRVQVKGRSEWVAVYEVFNADSPEDLSAKLSNLSTFSEAVSLYHQQNFIEASEAFKDCYQTNPNDLVVKIYLERFQQNIFNPTIPSIPNSYLI
ncbi:MAG: CHASE3 domain-containing protein [Limnoraphis robusta]|jgi:CHASE3 domain sensor protein/class 3 adenylate cyclase